MNDKVFESLFLEIEINGKNIICGTVYRSPNQNHHDFLLNLNMVLTESTKMNKNIIITGDMNFDLLSTDDNVVNSFTDTFFEFG